VFFLSERFWSFSSINVHILYANSSYSNTYLYHMYMYLSHCIYHSGLGFGMSYSPVLALVGKYFDKRRGMASGFVMAGASLGGLVGPPLLRYLVDEFGLKGALMIICGLLLNGVVVGALLRPLEFDLRKTHMDTVSYEHKDSDSNPCEKINVIVDLVELGLQTEHEPALSNLNDHSNRGIINTSAHAHSSPDLSVDMTSSTLLPREVMATKTRHRTASESNRSIHSLRSANVILDTISQSSFAKYADVCLSSMVSIQTVGVNTKHSSKKVELSPGSKDPGRADNRFIKQLKMYRSLFHNSRLILFNVAALFAFPGVAMVTTYIVPHAVDQGIDKSNSAMLVSIICGLDFVGRILFGILADRNWVKRHFIIAISIIILGIACHMTAILTEYWGVVLYAVVYGLCGGAYMAVYPVVLVDFVGIENLAASMGLLLLTHGIAMTAMNPVVGKISTCDGIM
jgi:MFS family permease